MVWVNTYHAVSYMSPFGGCKDSGPGRENGIDAIREYLQTKRINRVSSTIRTDRRKLRKLSGHLAGLPPQ
jgi:hypothetical protein